MDFTRLRLSVCNTFMYAYLDHGVLLMFMNMIGLMKCLPGGVDPLCTCLCSQYLFFFMLLLILTPLAFDPTLIVPD